MTGLALRPRPCTLDHCQAGACLSTIVTGVSCDDEDRCTTGDRCEVDPFGVAVCSGVATSCDDGNACTVDACDAVTGGCTHAPPGIGTISLLRLLDPMHVTWSTEPGAVSYNSYRGTIPDRGLGSRPPASRYDQTCFEAHDAAGDGAVTSVDPGIPLLGKAFYYLASEAAACGEGPIGHDSNGTPIPNSAPCALTAETSARFPSRVTSAAPRSGCKAWATSSRPDTSSSRPRRTRRGR